MQALVRKEDYPDLFYGDGLDAVAFYKKYGTAQEVFERENRQGLDVQQGVTAMIDSFWWWDKFIIEGIAITPSYASLFQESHPNLEVKTAFLIDRDRERIKERLYKRGLWDGADTYPDYIKPELGMLKRQLTARRP
jgi:2-phosphoglycerate kinase